MLLVAPGQQLEAPTSRNNKNERGQSFCKKKLNDDERLLEAHCSSSYFATTMALLIWKNCSRLWYVHVQILCLMSKLINLGVYLLYSTVSSLRAPAVIHEHTVRHRVTSRRSNDRLSTIMQHCTFLLLHANNGHY
jgi:hypothetical protein